MTCEAWCWISYSLSAGQLHRGSINVSSIVLAHTTSFSIWSIRISLNICLTKCPSTLSCSRGEYLKVQTQFMLKKNLSIALQSVNSVDFKQSEYCEAKSCVWILWTFCFAESCCGAFFTVQFAISVTGNKNGRLYKGMRHFIRPEN